MSVPNRRFSPIFLLVCLLAAACAPLAELSWALLQNADPGALTTVRRGELLVLSRP